MRRGLCDESSRMGEMDIIASLNPSEIQTWMIVVTGQSESLASAIWIHQTRNLTQVRTCINKPSQASRWLVRHRLGAGQVKRLERSFLRLDFPKLGDFSDEI
jgi:hypothetical protein